MTDTKNEQFYTSFSFKFEADLVKEFQLLIFGEKWTDWVETKEDLKNETDKLIVLAWLWANDFVENKGHNIVEVDSTMTTKLNFDYDCYSGDFDEFQDLEGHYEHYQLINAKQLLKGIVLKG